MLKCLLAMTHGLEQTYSNFGLGGMASVFQMMEITHTHFWSKDINEGTDVSSSSMLSSQSVSPMGSRENLRSPHSPTESVADWGPEETSRKSSIAVEQHQSRRASDHHVHHESQTQTTTEMFKDMLTQKRNVFFNKLSSFDSDVSIFPIPQT